MGKTTTKIINYAGMTESMGAVFSVIYGKDRVIMDFGSAFRPDLPNYKRVNENWVVDKINLGLLPAIDGLYSEDMLIDIKLQSYEESKYNTAIFISHLHLDHMSNIGAIAPKIPVYMSDNARRLEYALEDINEGVDTTGREYSVLDGNPVMIGQIKVTPLVTSDFSYNMIGYLIETPDLKVGYCADFSLTNECPDLAIKTMEDLRKAKVDVLYADVCNFNEESIKRLFNTTNPKNIPAEINLPEGMITHSEHYAKLEKLYTEVDGLIVFNHYEREMYDVEMIEKWAKKQKRQVVYEPKAAYLVHKFFNRKVSIFPVQSYAEQKWYRELMKNSNIVTRNDLISDPKKYMLHNSYDNIDELFKLQIKDSVYIHAEGNPFSSKDIEKMKKTVIEAGYDFRSYADPAYYQHGYPSHIKYFVDTIQPKVVIGYHGNHPEWIIPKYGCNLIPERYIAYSMSGNKLVKEII